MSRGQRTRVWRAPTTLALWVVVILAAGVGCRPGVPVVDTGETPPAQDGTIAGSVRGPGNSAPAVGRVVRAVALDSGRTYEGRTNDAGTYTIKVPPGRYRVEVVLNPGERLERQPGEVQIDKSDLDTDIDFVVIGGETPGGD